MVKPTLNLRDILYSTAVCSTSRTFNVILLLLLLLLPPPTLLPLVITTTTTTIIIIIVIIIIILTVFYFCGENFKLVKLLINCYYCSVNILHVVKQLNLQQSLPTKSNIIL